jgi:hypothetical protein
MAGEKVMEDAYRRGEDLHVLMARKITGKSEVSKEDRRLAIFLAYLLASHGRLSPSKLVPVGTVVGGGRP